MAKNNISLPSSGGGIMTYSKDYKSKLHLKPSHILFLIVLVLLIELILHTQFGSFFGI